MESQYKILFLEDNPDDVELMQHELTEARVNFVSRLVSKKDQILQSVYDFQPDVILVDYYLPSFNGMDAFRMIKQVKRHTPFILVTGAMSEQMALECLKEGVDDFILKSSFKRLPAAIINVIKKKEAEKEKARIATELRKSHEELKLLVERQETAREEERTTIARDLHDELGQVLTALKIDVSMLRKKVISGRPEKEIDAEFSSIINLIDMITQSVKKISIGLRSGMLDELGILEAIQWQAMEFKKRTNIECVTFLPSEPFELNRNFSIVIFRLVQEALTNIARHAASAKKVEIRLEANDSAIALSISDDGKGITQEEIESSKSLGIIGLRERVQSLSGRFTIAGRQGRGTVISVTIPLSNLPNENIEYDKAHTR